MEYTEPLITADKILDMLTREGSPGYVMAGNLYPVFGGKQNKYINQALSRLVEVDKYVDKRGTDHYYLSGTGQDFVNQGKYKGLCEREKERISKLSEKEKLEIDQLKSIIATNKSVQENFKSQNITTYISIGVGVLSLIFIGLSTYYQATDRTPTEVQKLKEEVKETQKKLQTIQSSLEGINSSIQTTKIDTVFVKK